MRGVHTLLRRLFPRDLTAPLVAWSQLTFATTLALILLRQDVTAPDRLGQAVFIVAVLSFGLASGAIARAAFGIHRRLFAGFASLVRVGPPAVKRYLARIKSQQRPAPAPRASSSGSAADGVQ